MHRDQIVFNRCVAILQKYWGYESFRTGQYEIVEGIIKKENVLAMLTTGGGKSICFQVAGLYLGGLTVVVSPLISLMADQVSRLNKQGIEAAVFNSTLSKVDKVTTLNRLAQGVYKFLYLAPESLGNKGLIDTLSEVRVNLIVIDEAHCVSMWGHDFRPSYLRINSFRKLMLDRQALVTIKMAAFTATATNRVQRDVIKQLSLHSPAIFKNSFLRANIAINVVKNMSEEQLLELINKRLKHSSVIVYASSRRRTEELTHLQRLSGLRAEAYHAGLSKAERADILESFLKDEIAVLNATNAFGMGVDKPNVYTVIHDSLPSSIEDYYQEAGRAGRDGRFSKSYVNFNWRSVNMRKQMIENKYPGPALYSEVFNWLVKKYRLNRGANLLFQPDSLLMEIQGLNVAKLQSILEELEQPGLIKLVTRKIQSSDQQMELVVLKPRVMFLSRYINFGKLQKQYQLGISRLKSIALLCTNDKCRMQYIMYYFGEKIQSCRQCDYCRLKHMNK